MKRYLSVLLITLCAAIAGAHGAYGLDHSRPDHKAVGRSLCNEDTITFSVSHTVRTNRYACVPLEDISGSMLGRVASHMVVYCGAHNAYIHYGVYGLIVRCITMP